MKQLLFTSCRSEFSVNRQSGFQVRAASRALSPDQQDEVRGLSPYFLPTGMEEDVPPAQAPTRLALNDLRTGARVLSQTTYVGQDPETKRFGNFFFHALVGNPSELDPLDALQTWKAPSWKTSDDDGPTDLAELPLSAFAARPPWNEARAARTIAEYGTEVQFILHALLVGSASRRQVFLAAPPDVVVDCLFAALLALPPRVRSKVTFSTYEKVPGTAPAQVVASCWGDRAGQDLDTQCYSGFGYAYNRYSRRRSCDMPPMPEFVGFALDAISLNRPTDLRAFHEQCARLGVSDAPAVASLYRLTRGTQPLTAADLGQESARALAVEICTRKPDTIKLLTDTAAADPNFRDQAFPSFVSALKQNPNILKGLAEALWEKGLLAAKAGNLPLVRLAWDDLPRHLGPVPDLGPRVIREVKPGELAPEVRRFLLPKIERPLNGQPDASILPWLSARPEELAEVLKALSNERLRSEAVKQAVLAHDPERLPPSSLSGFAASPGSALNLVGEVARANHAKALTLFESLVKQAPKTDWATELIRNVPTTSQNPQGWKWELLDRCLVVALKAQPKAVDFGQWAITHSDRVRLQLSEGESPALLAEMILGKESTRRSKEDELKAFLSWVLTTPSVFDKLNPETRRRLGPQFGINHYCENPMLSEQALRSLASHLRSLREETPEKTGGFGKALLAWFPGQSRQASPWEVNREDVLKVTVGKLLSTPGSACKNSLELTLFHLGPTFWGPGRWVDLFEELRDRSMAEKRFWQSDGLLAAFVSIGTGYTSHEGLRALNDDRAHGLADQLLLDMHHPIDQYPHSVAVQGLRAVVNSWRGDYFGWQNWPRSWGKVLSGEWKPPPADDPREPKGPSFAERSLDVALKLVTVTVIVLIALRFFEIL